MGGIRIPGVTTERGDTMTESKPTRAELAFEEWNASSASDKFEIDSIETYTAFLAGFEAAQSESKPTLPFRLPSEAPPVGHATMVLVIRNGRYVRRCQSQFAMKGEQEAGCHDRHLYMPYEWEDSVMAWMEEEAFLASFELWKKQKEGAE